MSGDIISRIQSCMSRFSKGQKRIAAYIEESYEKAAFLTASRLGQAVGVSESTVVRFAVELGYEGFPEMQRALQEMVLNRLTSVQRIEVASDRLANQDVVSIVFQSDIDKIKRTGDTIDKAAFAAAVDAILAAKTVYILGVRSSAPLANFLGYYLLYMFENVRVVTSASTVEMIEQVSRASDKDVVVGISFPRYSSATIHGVTFCKNAGAKVIGLTDSEQSPVGKLADHVLAAKSDMVSLADSLVAPLSLINALLVALAAKREKEVSGVLAGLERIWDEYEVYDKIDL